jgi:D-glycero-alpha-D-manno-heptose-7-phosphate kinase
LHESWTLKREISDDVSSSEIDQIYETARGAGALGGKILGAGGGGFMALFADPADHPRLRESLKGLVIVPIEIDFDGSKVVVFQPDKH